MSVRLPMIDWSWRVDLMVLGTVALTALWDGLYVLTPSVGLMGVSFAPCAWIARRRPAASLAGYWLLSLMALDAIGRPLLPQVVAALWIALCCGRWGRPPTVIASGVSVILGGVFTLSLVSSYSGGASVTSMAFALAVTGGVATPWAVGMRVRSAEFSREQAARACAAEERHLVTAAALAQAEAQEARLSKIADLEAASAQLARDVHDVVGHSLAVILAQAEAAQFQQEPRELHQSMTSIASSARRSLGEIREVLSRARAGGDGGRGGDLDQLIASLRASGVDVQQRCDGTPRALPPELEQVAYRVLQEMLTNAMRHGVSGGRIVVQLLWADRLMLQVRNLASGPEQQPRDLGGTGIPGIRTRLEAVGGSFELLCHDGDDAQVVVATAWLPLRSQG